MEAISSRFPLPLPLSLFLLLRVFRCRKGRAERVERRRREWIEETRRERDDDDDDDERASVSIALRVARSIARSISLDQHTEDLTSFSFHSITLGTRDKSLFLPLDTNKI